MSNTTIRDIAHDVQRDNPHLGSKSDVEHLIKEVFGVILERCAKGDNVKVRGFGVFAASNFKGRTLRSPLMKGGLIEFADQLVLRFRQSQSAKGKINEIAAEFAPKNNKSIENEASADEKAVEKKKVEKASSKKSSPAKKRSKKKPVAGSREEDFSEFSAPATE